MRSRSLLGATKVIGFSREVLLGDLRINGCVRLPGAYRSLPRPSSAPKPSHPPDSVDVSDLTRKSTLLVPGKTSLCMAFITNVPKRFKLEFFASMIDKYIKL